LTDPVLYLRGVRMNKVRRQEKLDDRARVIANIARGRPIGLAMLMTSTMPPPTSKLKTVLDCLIYFIDCAYA